MDPVRKALWFVEAHSREVLSLEDIAAACKVSPFHLTRVFAASTGLSLMRYVRARRLSQAALQLAREDVEILPLALEAGYGSHEAFTRAFVEQFARTPEQVRSQGHTNNLSLVREITMESAPASELAPPYPAPSPPHWRIRDHRSRPAVCAARPSSHQFQIPAAPTQVMQLPVIPY